MLTFLSASSLHEYSDAMLPGDSESRWRDERLHLYLSSIYKKQTKQKKSYLEP